MDIRKLQRAIVDGLEDVKGQHIAVFNTEHLSSMFERVIIASGTSNRQTKALAASVRDSVRKGGMQVLATEGEDNGEWIIVDCGAAVVHVMQPAIREYYHLEEIWGGKNVRVKVGEVNTKLVKASEPVPSLARSNAAKNAVKAAEKAAAQAISAAAGKPRAKRGEGAADVANKVANRSAAFKRVASKTPASKTPAAKRAPTSSRAPAKAEAFGAAAPAKKAAPAKRAAPAKTATRVAARTAPKAAPKAAPKTAAAAKTVAAKTPRKPRA
jgi:ribosome-associated protein